MTIVTGLISLFFFIYFSTSDSTRRQNVVDVVPTITHRHLFRSFRCKRAGYREDGDHSCFIVVDAAGVFTLPKILYIIIYSIYVLYMAFNRIPCEYIENALDYNIYSCVYFSSLKTTRLLFHFPFSVFFLPFFYPHFLYSIV